MSEECRSAFLTFFNTALNDEQRSAVAPQDGVFLVQAGAGAGKTRIITARMLYLMFEHAVPSGSIVALTFTNKASREMQERVERALPTHMSVPTIGTFHSYCMQLLKRYGSLIDLPVFSILDSDDREQCLKGIIKRANVAKRFTPQHIGGIISRHKNDIVSWCGKMPPLVGDPLYNHIFTAYEHEKRINRCIDFDDILLETLRLLQTKPECRALLQNSIRHILIDEYQDTNRIQHALIRELIMDPHKHLALESVCVVGDEDQSIYSWRGATIDNIVHFSSQFPQVTTITVDRNYRSVQQILLVANKVIERNSKRNDKTIWSARKGTNRVHVLCCASGYQEGEAIAACALHMQRTSSLVNLAVLYRSHFQSRAIEEALIRNAVPYKIIGGTQFYDRQEVKDILAYVRLGVNPFDRVSFVRCINTPSRMLGDAFVERFMTLWGEESDQPFYAIAQRYIDSGTLAPQKQATLQQFIVICATVAASCSAYEAVDTVITRTKFIEYLAHVYEAAEAQERAANVRELLAAVMAREAKTPMTPATFLDEVALLQEHIIDDESCDYVRLMTLHSAKGLEFDTVIIPGLEEGLFPSNQSLCREDAIEEERRLLYVGITRARERLFITRGMQRYMYGHNAQQPPSRFLGEIPAGQVRYTDISDLRSYQWPQVVSGWFSNDPTVVQANIVQQSALKLAHIKPATVHHGWTLRQKVQHQQFGVGTVVGVEQRAGMIYLMIQFQTGIKRIVSSYVTLCK